ncbi:MAG: HAMP domain-containing histidine kinase [Candidatus Marinimicrobia bacterium]|nr:HAMP domain-containing histidine kinase [Candidatus Neomarinimicrobiota bacterium]
MLYYSQRITNQLREESRETVTFYAETYAKFASENDVEDFSFFFEQFIQRMTFPVIISTVENDPSDWKNLAVDSWDKSEQALIKVRRLMTAMDELNDPIDLNYFDPSSNTNIVIARFHYGDSKLITQLRWLPYVEIAVAGLFILLGFAGFQFIRRSERQLIWAGMAKEAAHQLGTPLSSLMGWVEMLENADTDRVAKLLPEMSADLQRLNKVAQRFSHIGAGGGLKPADVNEVISKVVSYLEKRLPQRNKTVNISMNLGKLPEISVNVDLFEWALENIIKNSADAMSRKDGKIEVTTEFLPENKIVKISIKDNGSGIQPRYQKEIFKPGYSTKSTGWGLGLSLSKRIIEEYHGGKLFLVESSKETGTTMQISLKAE